MKAYHVGLLDSFKKCGQLGTRIKPLAGLWVSLNPHDWLEFLSKEAPHKINYQTFMYELELSGNFIHQSELIKYKSPIDDSDRFYLIDFDKIRADGYDGYVITDPFADGLGGYDIPQACVWNLDCLKIVNQKKCLSSLEIFYENLMKELKHGGEWREVSVDVFECLEKHNGFKKTVAIDFSLPEEIIIQITTDEKRTKVVKNIESFEIASYLA